MESTDQPWAMEEAPALGPLLELKKPCIKWFKGLIFIAEGEREISQLIRRTKSAKNSLLDLILSFLPTLEQSVAQLWPKRVW